MSLICSLLGHRFEEPTVEREREERGDEVVTISREIETCDRCGDRRVVSENTEIVTVEPTPGDVETDDEDEPLAGGEDLEARDPAEEDAEILEETESERAPGEWPAEPGDPTDPAQGAGDDGVETATGPALDETAGDAPPGTFHCPECGFDTDAAGSSLREGDSCPECRRGYLEAA